MTRNGKDAKSDKEKLAAEEKLKARMVTVKADKIKAEKEKAAGSASRVQLGSFDDDGAFVDVHTTFNELRNSVFGPVYTALSKLDSCIVTLLDFLFFWRIFLFLLYSLLFVSVLIYVGLNSLVS